MIDIYSEYVHLARLALEGKQKDILALLKRSARVIGKDRPELADNIRQILNETKLSEITRSVSKPIPIDIDSKLELLRKDYEFFDRDPSWPQSVSNELSSIIEERRYEEKLLLENLYPTRTMLFTGLPGVGKTLAAKWLSYKLDRPLLTLDLATVMSSYLGKTGNNIRAVLNYAQKNTSILLLDEFDSIAKRRDDDLEIGELKRLVTVLLQTIDEWPPNGLLIAATNHPELLDPAVWRRFERVIEFPTPSRNEIKETIVSLIGSSNLTDFTSLIDLLSILFEGSSYAEVNRQINNVRKESLIKQVELNEVLEGLAMSLCGGLPKAKKNKIADMLKQFGYSQRRVSGLTGISRDTLRRRTKNKEEVLIEDGQG